MKRMLKDLCILFDKNLKQLKEECRECSYCSKENQAICAVLLKTTGQEPYQLTKEELECL